MKVGMISLGCTKNLVDSETALGLFKDAGYVFTGDPAEADVLMVNTCGFIGPAKEESIDTILEMAQYKQTGNCKLLVVTGCLAQRYEKALMERDSRDRPADGREPVRSAGRCGGCSHEGSQAALPVRGEKHLFGT